jgi:aspartyl-tRNA(Asn)/glutamyl-tRNA(Gln) amidotransferase subunit A
MSAAPDSSAVLPPDTGLAACSAVELRRRLQAGEVSSVELTTTFLDRIEQLDGQVGAFLSVRREAALAEAAEIDRRRAAGDDVGHLAGLPVGVKDVLCVEGEATTCASKMLESYRPPYDATVVARIKAAGGVILGKLNMDEFAMGSSTENSAFQPTRNPWDLTRVPGGSSGGSAACIAAGLAPFAIGTDTGGSIRQPAAFCGVVGLKPTYGRVSRYGLVAFASSLDQVGPLGRTVEDAALMMNVIAGHDDRDSTSANEPTTDYLAACEQPLAGLRVGMVKEHFGEGLDDEVAAAVRAAADVYRGLGASIEEVSLPHSKYGIATYYVIAPSEASANLARYDGAHYGFRAEPEAAAGQADEPPLVRMYKRTRTEGFGPEVKRRIMLGTYALSAGYYDAYYVKALKVRRRIRQDYDAAFEQVDVILGPTTPTPAFKLNEKTDDPLAMYLADLYTVPANLAGLPGVAVPAGMSEAGLPIGMQLTAPPFAEARLLTAAAAYQRAKN